jgi:hypothetical protein
MTPSIRANIVGYARAHRLGEHEENVAFGESMAGACFSLYGFQYWISVSPKLRMFRIADLKGPQNILRSVGGSQSQCVSAYQIRHLECEIVARNHGPRALIKPEAMQ